MICPARPRLRLVCAAVLLAACITDRWRLPTGDASAPNDAPTNDAPTNDAPTNDAPTNDAPTNDAPANDAPPAEVSPVTSIVAGFSHSCALSEDGTVRCWGNNTSGELGDGSTEPRETPVRVRGLSGPAVGISAGYGHSCAVLRSGGVQCWGSNADGQLGDGTRLDRSTPVAVARLNGVAVEVAAGGAHTCARLNDGGVRCWGRNEGALGDGTRAQRAAPVAVFMLNDAVTELIAGQYHTCARTPGGRVFCWGFNGFGALGDGTIVDRYVPTEVALGAEAASISTLGNTTCAALRDARLQCWGFNGHGAVGDNSTVNRSRPVLVRGTDLAVESASAGNFHSCARLRGGGVRCWGHNLHGELGDGTTNGALTPGGLVALGGEARAVAAGGDFTCALVPGGAVRCWGFNGDGELGDGTLVDRAAPVDVRFQP